MIDFTTCEVNKFKAYGGANGNKINILYEGKEYMLKFPPVPGKKLSYFAYISSLKDPDCNAALKRIYERIDMDKINRVVEETPFLEPVQREFYQIMLKERKEKILDFSMELLLKQELNE